MVYLSCTTTKERLVVFEYCFKSLLSQSLSPDVFYVNLAKEEFRAVEDLPYWLIADNVKVQLVEDIRSYKKLLPVLDKLENNDLVITCDDDTIYHTNWLKELVQSHKENPNMIICSRARLMCKNILGVYTNYSLWPLLKQEYVGLDILPIGVGGVVYKKSLLDMGFLTDRNFLKIAPTTDDLWFKVASLRRGIKVKVVPNIDRLNMNILHPFGLENQNMNKTVAKNLLFRLVDRIYSSFRDYVGIRVTKNDINWKKLTDGYL